MNKLSLLLFAPALVLSPLTACADPPGSLGRQARAILQTHCGDCHGGGKGVKGGFGFVLDRERLVSRLLVVPGQAGKSDLLLRIQQGEMPPPARKLRPSPDEIKLLQAWIDAGAPAFDETKPTARIPFPHETTEIILADLQRDPRQGRFTRYLSLNHLAHAGLTAKDLQTTREAVGKLLNSLSWQARIGLPEPVDAAATILRIDLRAYKWTAQTWEKLVAVYPYRFHGAAETKAFKSLAGTEVPMLRADWLVANASRPPLYHDLLQLPVSDRALERLLQVDVAADVQDDNIARAGFNDSGVSKNNRLLERHDAAFGTLWRSYDFANNVGRHNLFEHPLGPNTGAVSFQPAGGEMIFHLPNGLQAYMLVDAKGKRINKAPSEIVADPRRPDQRVETGISCMSCHARGLLPKADQVRAHVEKNAAAFGKAVVDTIRATHPRKAQFQSQIEEDNLRYLRALEKFGVRDPDQEPINLVTQRHEATLDGRTAAAELGLTLVEFARFLKQNPDQARVFGGLPVPGGTVQREVFQENFPELARRIFAAQAIKEQPSLATAFQGHTATVNSVAFSSDGEIAASAGDDHTIRIWTIPAGRELACLESPSEIAAVAFSTDGKYLLGAGRDRLVRLWDLSTKKSLRVFKGHTGPLLCVAFSPNGKWAASGGDDRCVRVWDVASGEEKSTLVGHAGAITGVAWSADGKHLLSGSRDGTARWWNWKQEKQLALLEGHAGPVLSVAVALDGKTALSGGNDKTVRLWSLANGKELHRFEGHANAVIQVKFHPSRREILSGSSQHQGSENTWRRWDLTRLVETNSMTAGEEARFGCTAFSPDGRRILAGGPGGFLRVWDW